MIIDSPAVREYLKMAYESSLEDLYHVNRDLAMSSGYFKLNSFLDRTYSGEARDALGDIQGQVEEQFLLTPIPNEKFKSLKDLKARLVWFASHLKTKKEILLRSIKEYEDHAKEFPRACKEIPEPLADAIGLVEKYLTATEVALKMKDITQIEEINNIDVGTVGDVSNILARFSVFIRTLDLDRRKDDGAKRTVYKINDEYDVQDMLAAILKLSFDDVRREEPGPSFGASKARCDLYIPSHGVFIEIKTSLKKSSSTIYSDFKSDIPDYLNHPGCKTLILFTYDPGQVVTNRGKFEELKRIGLDGSKSNIVVVFS